MKAVLITAALGVACGAAALCFPCTVAAQSMPDRQTPGFHARLYERYCEKLREGPQAYGQFVQRLRTVYGYAVSDFAVYEEEAPLRDACRTDGGKLALALAARQKETTLR